MKRAGLLVAFLSFAVTGWAEALPAGEGQVLVRAHCSGCHSLALVTSQRGDAQFWEDTIRWMQRTQNLWQIPAPMERTLIDYLAAHFNETQWGRRPPLRPELLPSAQ